MVVTSTKYQIVVFSTFPVFWFKTKIRKKIIFRDLLFSDDSAVASYTQKGLQKLMDNFSNASNLLNLTISQKKPQEMGQGTPLPPAFTINGKDPLPGSVTYTGWIMVAFRRNSCTVNSQREKRSSTTSRCGHLQTGHEAI